MAEKVTEISKNNVCALFGGDLPAAEGFCWERVDHFRVNVPGTLQGFDGFGEPVGPTIEYSIKVLSSDEEIAAMRA